MSSLEFDYFSCMDDGLIVDHENAMDHLDHNIVGQQYVIKAPKKKIMQGMVSRNLVNKEREKLNVIRFEKREEADKKKELLAQKRFQMQIPDGDVIVNLLEIEV